jgi:hypothetical protein
MSESVMPPSGRGMLLLIVGLLLLPFAIGGGLYLGGWQPPRSESHGRLLNPPQALPDDVLRSTEKNRGKWLLLLEVSGACEAECLGRLDEMRRIHVALYKNMSRLSRGLITRQRDDPMLAELRNAQPDLQVVAAPSGVLTASTTTLLLADPQGQVVIIYAPDATARGIRADLDRLLKFTWNG